jgi:hypothetical protein
MHDRLKKIVHNNIEVLVIDYSNCKEPDMIELVVSAKELILRENKEVVILSILNNKTYVTPKFIRALETDLRIADHLILRNAVTGISEIQRWIVKGINLWYKTKVHVFDSYDEALEFLVS